MHSAKSMKVASSIRDGVIEIFHWLDASGRTNGPGVDSASDRNEYQDYFLGGKGGRCVGLTTLPPSCADCPEILGASASWNPLGLSGPVIGLFYLFTLADGTDRQSRNVGKDTLPNSPEEHSSRLLRGGSMKSCVYNLFICVLFSCSIQLHPSYCWMGV